MIVFLIIFLIMCKYVCMIEQWNIIMNDIWIYVQVLKLSTFIQNYLFIVGKWSSINYFKYFDFLVKYLQFYPKFLYYIMYAQVSALSSSCEVAA